MENPSRDRWLAVVYAATIFLSAFLLFQVQPLVSKYILPWFGGSPAVWTTALLFFQSLLFAGYAYAHLLHSLGEPRRQAVVHLVLLAAALAMLGVLPGDRWQPTRFDDPVWQILLILTISVGLPYFVLASTGPLIQAWYARSFPGRIPYRLYALSNVGSLLALLSYPFFFEWALDLPRQALLWSAGFVAYAVLCGYAAWRVRSRRPATPTREGVRPKHAPESRKDSATAPGWTDRLLWLVWPALASVMLMATTNYISADIAAVPFLWVVPLALYLLTFIIVFDRPGWYFRPPVAIAMLVAIYATALVHRMGVGWREWDDLADSGMIGLLASAFVDRESQFHLATWEYLVANLAAMFFACLLCHGELVRLRPHPKHLTAFYLMIAGGGALGGVFVAIVAPQIFATYFEWQLSLFVVCLLGIGIVLHALVKLAFGDDDAAARRPWHYLVLAVLVLAVFLPSAVMLVDVFDFVTSRISDATFRTRNFFGTLAVLERTEGAPENHYVLLRHGSITHGAQFMHANRRREPTTYYGRSSGVARAIDYYRRELESDRMKLGVVGLGTGSLAAYADGGDSVTFYEINPAVVQIAESDRWFTFLKDCRARGAECEIHLGDARLTLRRELGMDSPPQLGEGSGEGSETQQAAATGQNYHLLVLDAFSGDAIPVHLLTVEAFELYLAHLSVPGDPSAAGAQAEHGAIAVHISNRYLDLTPLVRGIAAHFGLHALYIENDADNDMFVYTSDWMIVTRNDRLAEELAHFVAEPEAGSRTVLWTDAHSSLVDVLE